MDPRLTFLLLLLIMETALPALPYLHSENKYPVYYICLCSKFNTSHISPEF